MKKTTTITHEQFQEFKRIMGIKLELTRNHLDVLSQSANQEFSKNIGKAIYAITQLEQGLEEGKIESVADIGKLNNQYNVIIDDLTRYSYSSSIINPVKMYYHHKLINNTVAQVKNRIKNSTDKNLANVRIENTRQNLKKKLADLTAEGSAHSLSPRYRNREDWERNQQIYAKKIIALQNAIVALKKIHDNDELEAKHKHKYSDAILERLELNSAVNKHRRIFIHKAIPTIKNPFRFFTKTDTHAKIIAATNAGLEAELNANKALKLT